MKLGMSPSLTMQNWNKNFIVRSQQRRKIKGGTISNEQFGILSEASGEAKNNMFMAWKDRNNSHIRLQSSANKYYTEVIRSIKKSTSERKFREIPYDL
jgi:beta-lactamase class D